MFAEFITSFKCQIRLPSVPVYSDEHINYWTDVWMELDLKYQNILLETFLAFPHDILKSIDEFAKLHRPLLPEQKKVQRRVWLDELDQEVHEQAVRKGARVNNGHLVEPMRHHTWPANHRRSS